MSPPSRTNLNAMAAALLGACCCVLAPTGAAWGDLIKLKNGGELRGRIQQRRTGPAENQPTTIRTLSGALVVVDPAEIEFVTRRSLKVEHYESRARATPDTVEDQWELAEWCRRNRLTTQRDEHLERVLELAPDHEEAHRALGHMLQDGDWTSRDEIMKAQGYVKYRGRYVSAQELESIEENESEREAEYQWYKKIRLWYGWLDRADRQGQGEAKLLGVDHPDAVRALAQFFAEEKDVARRSMYVDILSRIPGDKSVEALVRQSLNDPESHIRQAAFEGLSADQFDVAYQYYLEALSDENNMVLQRAASALGDIANMQAIPHLIDALVTTHRYRVQIRDTTKTIAFGADGSFRMGAQPIVLPPEIELGLRTGQFPNGVVYIDNSPRAPTRTVTIKQEHENSEVRRALRKLTGQNFGYDRRDWALWWASQKQAGVAAPAVP